METLNNETLTALLKLDTYLAIFFILTGFGFLAFYRFRLGQLKDLLQKYVYMGENETKFIWYAFLAFVAAVVLEMEIFLPFAKAHHNPIILYSAGLFTSGMFATILAFIFYKWLQLYYPSILNQKLLNLRNKPRISPKTGKPMKLLSEEEEDAYLSEGMQAEEIVFSIDYDVWLDEESGHVQIEKYQGRLHAQKCPQCSFETLRDVKEEIVDSPSVEAEGKLMKHYQCNYCNYKEKRTFKIAKLRSEELVLMGNS